LECNNWPSTTWVRKCFAVFGLGRAFQTYVIGVGSEVVKYLREISGMTYEILNITIDSALLYLVNFGKDFIPKTLFIKDDKNMFQNQIMQST
jgi:hypothetical protein